MCWPQQAADLTPLLLSFSNKWTVLLFYLKISSSFFLHEQTSEKNCLPYSLFFFVIWPNLMCICNIFLWQTNAIKEFYEENEAEDQSGVNRLIWVTKKGIFYHFLFIFYVGDQEGDASHSFHLYHCLLGGWLCQVSVRMILLFHLTIVVFRFNRRAPIHRD